MPERTTEELRLQIASERQALAADMDVLRDQVRALKPVVVAATIAIGLLASRRLLKVGFRLLTHIR
jgi:hypothetical protein